MSHTQLPSQARPQKEPTAQRPRKSLNESKSAFEFLFKAMFLGSSIFSAVLFNKVYLFQTLSEFDGIRQGSLYDMLYYSLPFGVGFTLLDLFIHYLFDDIIADKYIDDKKYPGEKKHKRAYTIVKWIYSLAYYFISTLAALYLIKDTSFFPTWLGGNGSCMNIIKGAPALPQATYGMKVFYLFQFGKHFSRLFSHMYIRSEGNYYEFVLHHALSSFLILFSYLTNQWLVGIMVLFCHDISDFFLILGRGYRDYKHYSRMFLKMLYVPGALFWVGGRLIIFPICCVYPALHGGSTAHEVLTASQEDVLGLPYKWMGYMLVGLMILQFFWTYYIIQAFVSVNVSTKVSNTYE